MGVLADRYPPPPPTSRCGAGLSFGHLPGDDKGRQVPGGTA